MFLLFACLKVWELTQNAAGFACLKDTAGVLDPVFASDYLDASVKVNAEGSNTSSLSTSGDGCLT